MDLSELATVLRESGGQVLNGESKLSLSTELLKELNEKFKLVVEDKEAFCSTFQVISSSNSKVELLDLQFLHDFVQRTVGLKLIEDNSHCDPISIHKFKNLKLLELRKIPLQRLTGLQSLRSQLQYIICVRCVQNLKELFTNCGGDKSQAFIWSELKEAVLSYNNLECIDDSFELTPWLQTLDLSHNLISDAKAIDCLPNLKHLNLSFNHLETVPIFKKELFKSLQTLILKSNYIGDLLGLMYLDNLVTLDLSCNCLIDHKILSPLSLLTALQWLNLEGNPLSFHPNHRDITCRYLHSNTGTMKFILDKILLTKHEQKLVGTYHPSLPNKIARNREHQSSVCSNISDLTNSSEVTTIAAVELTRSQNSYRGRKIRDAIISEKDENDERDDEGEIINPELFKSINSIASLNLSSEHVETQKKIESLREQYGANWLHNQSGSIIGDILGFERTEPRQSSTPYTQDFMIHASELFDDKKTDEVQISAGTPVDSDHIDVTSDVSVNNTFVTASESSRYEDNDIILSEPDSPGNDREEDHFEEDEDERPYLAQLREGAALEEVFVIISDKYLKERSYMDSRVKAKWLLEVILSSEIISQDSSTIVRIEFDTVRRNMKEREYILTDADAQELHREISSMMSQRSLSAMNQSVYCCMKCSTQFSRQKNETNGLPGCPNPNCTSTLVYEVDDESTPTNLSLAQNIANRSTERPESPSECSIASETESNQLAQIHVTAEVHMDNYSSTLVPANCSAASVQESNSSHLSTDDAPLSDNILRKYESDIEVISNPSQSSIEVLDDQFRLGRKRSSEERRTVMQPTLVTIPDVVAPVSTTITSHALTESSSSSSFTESVCTAYDTTHHISHSMSGLEIKGVIKEELETNKETKDEEKGKTMFTSLFEGLFSGPTTGTKSIKSTDDLNDIEFTYTEDFSNVDHRVKCHLYQNIFEDEHENFVWILRCVFLSLKTVQPVQGCLVLSTYKVYILLLKEHKIGEDLMGWLVKKESYTIDRLQTVFTLPWKQGIGLEIRDAAKKNINHLCILQDMHRTSNFLAFLATNPLPDSCDVVCVSPERPMLNLQHLLLSNQNEGPKDSTLCLLSVFSKCVITDTATKTVILGVFLVTHSDLILLPDLEWLIPESDKEPVILNTQPISNLMEVNLEKSTLEFHFLDELAGCEEIWAIQFETTDSLNTAISAVKAPWEKIFSVPMQINHKVHFGE